MSSLTFQLSERPVERLAEVAALSVPGSIALDAKLAGLAGRSFPRVIAQIERRAGTASFEAEIATSYPCPITDVTESVRAAIISHVEALTGLDVTRVRVNVANVRSGEGHGRVTVTEVANHSVQIVPLPIRVHSSSENLAPSTVAPRRPLDPIRVSEAQPLQDIQVPEAQPLQDIRVPDAPQLQDVRVPEAQPLQGVETPPPPAVRETIPLPPLGPLLKIHTPPIVKVPVHTPPAPQARRVVAPAPRPALAVQAPAPQPLRRITIKPLRRGYVAQR